MYLEQKEWTWKIRVFPRASKRDYDRVKILTLTLQLIPWQRDKVTEGVTFKNDLYHDVMYMF
jgi:hypothetical protein